VGGGRRRSKHAARSGRVAQTRRAGGERGAGHDVGAGAQSGGGGRASRAVEREKLGLEWIQRLLFFCTNLK